MANQTLTVEQFDRRFELIDRKTEAEMRNGATRYFNCTAGNSGEDDEGNRWLYVNLLLKSECDEKVNNLAFEQDGKLVVKYEDMAEHLTNASATTEVGTTIPETFLGEDIRVAVKLIEKDGETYLNVLKIMIREIDGSTASLTHQKQKVEQ